MCNEELSFSLKVAKIELEKYLLIQLALVTLCNKSRLLISPLSLATRHRAHVVQLQITKTLRLKTALLDDLLHLNLILI